MELEFEVYAKIQKPVHEVFEAVYNPEKLSGYFTTGGASARLDEGTEVTWDFHDYPGAFPVKVIKTVPNETIVFEWADDRSGDETRVEMTFEELDGDATLVKIKESGWKKTQESLKYSYGNCMGWSQMLCFLKVYVEDGKNLRTFFY
ncbi:SRPBCC family protein [Sulfidibacter corallicola]|uniref:SRPBCC family protein n=1 Tax=Sulfidibacter corallicola TaxID=2818388 RepID=A0A8A4TN09_SULCO|nr:SRPBCC family protein [Sulfidibacter corallicola]QTD47975.1 SRPBCC family protein [Sulfidibacter corallicola]